MQRAIKAVHNKDVEILIRDCYEITDIRAMHSLFIKRGVFDFFKLPSGLFPAAHLREGGLYTGYYNAWIRDNIFVALAHYVNGYFGEALGVIHGIFKFFITNNYEARLLGLIEGKIDHRDPMNRPHIRFDGANLVELPEKWAHAENDAIGYFIWMVCQLGDKFPEVLGREQRAFLTLLCLYLRRIHFWEDEDSGHWEEARKISASSIGVVTGALIALRKVVQARSSDDFRFCRFSLCPADLDDMIAAGRQALEVILPFECCQAESSKQRRYDAALLFLIWPMNVVSEEMARQIVADVTDNLVGDYGIRRYLGDSFWSPDYKDLLKTCELTADFSDRIEERNVFSRFGEEAQWCIFDSILSIIYGRFYARTGRQSDLEYHVYYFNRSVAQVTGENCPYGAFRCPELYYRSGMEYITNDCVPLLWSQANLWMAFRVIEETHRRLERPRSIWFPPIARESAQGVGMTKDTAKH